MNITTLNTTTLDGGVIIKKGGGGGTTPPSVGGGESGGSTLEYLDVRGIGDLRPALGILAGMVKSSVNEGTYVGTTLMGIQEMFGSANTFSTVVAVAIDFTKPIRGRRGGQEIDMLIADLLIMRGIPKEELDAIPRITKEQFYDLNA